MRITADKQTLLWPQQIASSMRNGRNQLNDPEMLLHVMETTLRMQCQAIRVR